MIGRCRICCSKVWFNHKFSSKRNYSNEKWKNIVIPKKIERGPTDILQALSSTVGTDLTAAHYKFHDDPYLIPQSNIAKRMYAMSEEAGRKAAKWIVNEHPDLFQHKHAEPFIEAYAPKQVYNENSKVGEDTLIKVIEDGFVSDAIIIYQLLEKNKIELKQSTKQSMLELLCFYNCEDPIPEEWIEERWFRQGVSSRDKFKNSTRSHEIIESIFREMKNPDEKVYSTLIQGNVKYWNTDQAWKLYQEALEKKLELDVNCYNSLIKAASVLKESTDMKWKLVKELLEAMSEKKLTPNVKTLNSVLFVTSTFNHTKQALECSLSILSEFKNINITPCLSSYYWLLMSVCRDKGPIYPILHDIMDEIEDKEFAIQDNKDTFFFVTAMELCRRHLRDIELAKRVDKLLHKGTNYNLIGDSLKESVYYRHFFLLSIAAEPLDAFMEMYNKLVPHIYTPEPAVVEELLKSVSMNGAVEYISKIWSDMIIFGYSERENLLSLLLETLVSNQPAEDDLEQNKIFADIAWDIWEKASTAVSDRQMKMLTLSGKSLSNILLLCVRNNDVEKSWKVFMKLDLKEQDVVFDPSLESLYAFFDFAITKNETKKALRCLEFCVEMEFPDVVSMAKRMQMLPNLDENISKKLDEIIGTEP